MLFSAGGPLHNLSCGHVATPTATNRIKVNRLEPITQRAHAIAGLVERGSIASDWLDKWSSSFSVPSCCCGRGQRDRKRLPTFRSWQYKCKTRTIVFVSDHHFKCYRCNRRYKHKSSLISHLRNECGIAPKYHCSRCTFKTKLPRNLKLHMLNKHTEELVQHEFFEWLQDCLVFWKLPVSVFGNW